MRTLRIGATSSGRSPVAALKPRHVELSRHAEVARARTQRDAARWGARSVRRLGAWVACASWLLAAPLVRADAPASEAPTFEIPPAPSSVGPRTAFEAHAVFAFPLDTGSLCPRGVGCVLQGGGGIGASLERRWPKGFGAFAAYDMWFLDSDSVYELGVQQALHAGFRFTMPTEVVFHPVFEVSLGIMGYGDTFAVETVGALAQFFAGAEVELNRTVGLRVGVGMRVFSHGSFRTERDRILRGSEGVFAESMFLSLGLTVM